MTTRQEFFNQLQNWLAQSGTHLEIPREQFNEISEECLQMGGLELLKQTYCEMVVSSLKQKKISILLRLRITSLSNKSNKSNFILYSL